MHSPAGTDPKGEAKGAFLLLDQNLKVKVRAMFRLQHITQVLCTGWQSTAPRPLVAVHV
jgi:hypothetical protein